MHDCGIEQNDTKACSHSSSFGEQTIVTIASPLPPAPFRAASILACTFTASHSRREATPLPPPGTPDPDAEMSDPREENTRSIQGMTLISNPSTSTSENANGTDRVAPSASSRASTALPDLYLSSPSDMEENSHAESASARTLNLTPGRGRAPEDCKRAQESALQRHSASWPCAQHFDDVHLSSSKRFERSFAF